MNLKVAQLKKKKFATQRRHGLGWVGLTQEV